MVIPAALVIVVGDLNGLADLYAVGVVGAIATNLGACSTDRKLGLTRGERLMMFLTFLIMLTIELSLFWDKPNARVFATSVLLAGLFLRGLAAEYSQRQKRAAAAKAAVAPVPAPGDDVHFHGGGRDRFTDDVRDSRAGGKRWTSRLRRRGTRSVRSICCLCGLSRF